MSKNQPTDRERIARLEQQLEELAHLLAKALTKVAAEDERVKTKNPAIC